MYAVEHITLGRVVVHIVVGVVGIVLFFVVHILMVVIFVLVIFVDEWHLGVHRCWYGCWG